MKKQEKCSICNKKFKRILSLGYHPCADTFVKDRKIAINLKRYPLEVGFCECNHLTSINKVSPYERYQKNNYSYTANNSPISLNHFNTMAKRMVKDFNITSKNSVLEIGSNDGTFLKNIKDLSKVNVLGIDPSDYMCKLANKKGIRTLSKFFNYQSSKLIEKKYGKFDFLYGANVFNHVDDPKNFLKCCKLITKPKSIIILEVPDLDSLFKGVGFDTIYHEHRNYFSKKSLLKIFEKVNLEICKFEYINYMSGSLRIFARNNKFKKSNIKLNNKKNHLKKFLNFEKKIKIVKSKIISFVNKIKKNNKIVVGLGAATKGNTLLNFCKFSAQHITCILDNSPYKIGKFAPGSGIPIMDEKKFRNYHAIIILPWNITNHLHEKFLQNTNIPYTSIAKITSKIDKRKDMTESKYIENVFADERGEIYDIFTREPKDHCSLITFNKDSVRGDHFHKKSIQSAFILDGIFKIYDAKVDVNGKFDKKNIRIYEVKKNCYITHNAYEAHTYTCLSKTGSIIVFTTGIRGGRFYEDDTYRLKKELTD